MAHGCPTTTTSSLLLFFTLSCLIIGQALCNNGHHGRTSGADYAEQYHHQESPVKHIVSQETMKACGRMTKERTGRREETLTWRTRQRVTKSDQRRAVKAPGVRDEDDRSHTA